METEPKRYVNYSERGSVGWSDFFIPMIPLIVTIAVAWSGGFDENTSKPSPASTPTPTTSQVPSVESFIDSQPVVHP